MWASVKSVVGVHPPPSFHHAEFLTQSHTIHHDGTPRLLPSGSVLATGMMNPPALGFNRGIAHDRRGPDLRTFGQSRATKLTSIKGKMLAEMLDSISKDPLSVQFLTPWISSLLPGRSPLGENLPWMNFRVIRWLKSFLQPSMSAFEYGAGGSTVFLAERVRNVVTVEHDPRWYDLVARTLRKEGVSNCDLRLVRPVRRSGPADVAYGPDSYSSLSPEERGLSFEAYVRTIDEYPDQSFDLVIVDGYARPSCVAHAIPKVRHGRYLLVDDTDWPKYAPTLNILDGYPRVDFAGVTPFQLNLRQTSIWRM